MICDHSHKRGLLSATFDSILKAFSCPQYLSVSLLLFLCELVIKMSLEKDFAFELQGPPCCCMLSLLRLFVSVPLSYPFLEEQHLEADMLNYRMSEPEKVRGRMKDGQ